MTAASSRLYAGRVVHQRVKPRRHRLAYNVFALCLDVDEIDVLARELRLFSRNRFNWISFHDADHGAGDGRSVGDHARGLLRAADLESYGARIRVLCYPRILGYVFNPLSVYFCEDEAGRLGAIVYEVNNTFGERKSYVIPATDEDRGAIRQSCGKEMYVSPFTHADGRYSFHIRPPSDEAGILVGIAFHDGGGAVLNARFSGDRHEISDRKLFGMLLRHPLMTIKVIGAIHLEAAKLWAKGVPLVPRHVSPAYSFSIVSSSKEQSSSVHA